MSLKFYKCEICGNIVVKVADSGVIPACCGEEMTELQPNTQEPEKQNEKHLPVATFVGCQTLHVRIGLTEHPMTPEHFIHLVAVETDNGLHIRFLKSDDKPDVRFCLGQERPVAIYEYCNLHGLWKITAPVCKTC